MILFLNPICNLFKNLFNLMRKSTKRDNVTRFFTLIFFVKQLLLDRIGIPRNDFEFVVYSHRYRIDSDASPVSMTLWKARGDIAIGWFWMLNGLHWEIISTDSLSFLLIVPLKALANRQRFSCRFTDFNDTGDGMHYWWWYALPVMLIPSKHVYYPQKRHRWSCGSCIWYYWSL